jgi:hypothetical protein
MRDTGADVGKKQTAGRTILRQFTVAPQVSRFCNAVLENHITLGVLVVTQTDQDDIAGADPDLMATRNGQHSDQGFS